MPIPYECVLISYHVIGFGVYLMDKSNVGIADKIKTTHEEQPSTLNHSVHLLKWKQMRWR